MKIFTESFFVPINLTWEYHFLKFFFKKNIWLYVQYYWEYLLKFKNNLNKNTYKKINDILRNSFPYSYENISFSSLLVEIKVWKIYDKTYNKHGYVIFSCYIMGNKPLIPKINTLLV